MPSGVSETQLSQPLTTPSAAFPYASQTRCRLRCFSQSNSCTAEGGHTAWRPCAEDMTRHVAGNNARSCQHVQRRDLGSFGVDCRSRAPVADGLQHRTYRDAEHASRWRHSGAAMSHRLSATHMRTLSTRLFVPLDVWKGSHEHHRAFSTNSSLV